MSKWVYDFSQSVADRLEPFLKEASSKEALRRIQAVYFRARYGDSAREVAQRTGLALQTVRNIHSAWRREGNAALELKPKGGRYHEHLTLDQERSLLASVQAEAERGGVLEVSRIHQALEQLVGAPVARSTTYRLLHRHGWRKIAPRGHHPAMDKEAQDAFKKTGQTSSGKRKKTPESKEKS